MKLKVQGLNPGLGSLVFENETVHAKLTFYVQPICAIEVNYVIKLEKIQADLNSEMLGYSCPMRLRNLNLHLVHAMYDDSWSLCCLGP